MARPIPDLDPMTAAEVASDDQLIIDDTSAGETKRIPVGELIGLPKVGWTATAEVWSFSSWNATTTVGVVNVPTNALNKYSVGMFVMITQATGGIKYGRILSITSTTLTIWFFGYTLNNEAITTPFYSPLAHPQGLPITIAEGNPYKFQVYRQSAWTPGGSGTNTIPFDTKAYDPLGMHSTVTHVFTPQVSGYYDISTRASAGAQNRMFLSLLRNSIERLRGTDFSASAGGAATAINGKGIYLAAGDTCTITLYFAAVMPAEVLEWALYNHVTLSSR